MSAIPETSTSELGAIRLLERISNELYPVEAVAEYNRNPAAPYKNDDSERSTLCALNGAIVRSAQ